LRRRNPWHRKCGPLGGSAIITVSIFNSGSSWNPIFGCLPPTPSKRAPDMAQEKPTSKIIEETTDQWAFLMKSLGMKLPF
jgi:hypothetical protein